ncbi:hypothetical protein F5Y11DRAFT_16880 [Daldinia sp. FL1419]|nr:hypothetical protein F5Y11DRAFT_16880 [Daldinia sp. FL1419]
MERLRGYLKRLTPDGRSEARRIPPMPILPDDRPRPLKEVAPLPEATANSTFFQSLPPEIRRHILIKAFGERVLHLDLRLEHPLRKAHDAIKPGLERHANVHLFHPSLRDTVRAREWTWWSSICHNRYPSHHFDLSPPGIDDFSRGPANDTCRSPFQRHSCLCEAYPGTAPAKCFVGVSGWLLVCRQAYIEGVDVLYSTNRFHLAYPELAICLPRFVPREHIAAMRAVEVIWSFTVPSGMYFSWDADDKSGLQNCDGASLLERLPQVFPNLHYLYLSLINLVPKQRLIAGMGGRETYDAIEEILRKVDEVIIQLPQLQECRVGLPSSLYTTRKLVEMGRDIDWNYRGCVPDPEALWRSIPLVEESTNLDSENQSIGGYWIVHGYRDMEILLVPEVA